MAALHQLFAVPSLRHCPSVCPYGLFASHSCAASATVSRILGQRTVSRIPAAVSSAEHHPRSEGVIAQPHISVMLGEILEQLQAVDMRTYVDCTLGAGGHAAAMLQAHQVELMRGC